MSDILLSTHIGALVWLISGLVLCAAETMAPGAFLIWVGLAASIVGAIAYFVTVGFTSQLLLFGALVAGLVLLGRRVYGSLDASPGPLPQSRARSMVLGETPNRSEASSAVSGGRGGHRHPSSHRAGGLVPPPCSPHAPQSAAGEAAPMRRKSGQAEGGPMLLAGVDAWRASPGLYLTLLPTRTTPPSGRSLRILSGTCPPAVSLLTCSRIRE